MKRFLKALGYSRSLETKVRYTYIITAISLSLVLFFLLFYIFYVRSPMVNLFTSLCTAAIALVFLFMKKGMYNTGKTLLLTAYLSQMYALIFIWFPVDAKFNYFLFTFAPITFFIYDLGLRKDRAALIIINTMVLVMLVLSEILILDSPLVRLTENQIRLFGGLSAFCTLASIILVFYSYAGSLHRIHRDLDRMANTDALTGSLNRRSLYREGESLLAYCRRYDRIFSALVLDIDHFKLINDEYGHPAGDAVLIQLTDLIRKHIRESDILSRFGGEEFVILLKESRIKTAEKAAEHIRERVENHGFVLPGGRTISMTVSIGAAELKTEHLEFKDIFSAADTALYAAKEGGRNRVMPAR